MAEIYGADYLAVIKVVGVGGGGGNAVNRMVEAGIRGGVEFIAVNTDAQDLLSSSADIKVQIGGDERVGLGAGGSPDDGAMAAEASRSEIRSALAGADMIFITCGEGGGTGTGASPVVAEIAHDEIGALTVGVVTKPFRFEGPVRMRRAEEGIALLRERVDTLIIIPNERLREVVGKGGIFVDAFRIADDILRQAIQGITDLITMPGMINLDFADVRSVMKDGGTALMGIGIAAGENRAAEAAQRAIENKLLDYSIEGANKLLVLFSAGSDMEFDEIYEAMDVINERLDENPDIKIGAIIDDSMGDQIRITVIATGFDDHPQMHQPSLLDEQYSAPASTSRSTIDEYASLAPSSFDDEDFVPPFLKKLVP